MKKTVILILISFAYLPNAMASEIFGTISTAPQANIQQNQAANTATSSASQSPPATANGGAVPIIAKQLAVVPASPTAEPVLVLGLEHYPDGSLLRGRDKKVYLVAGKIKRHISSLDELHKYRGKTIYQVTEEILQGYADGHLDGELVRQRGEVKVYVLQNGKRKHILNLEELRKYYFKKEIYNISSEEMGMY